MKVLIADKFPEDALAALTQAGVAVVYDPDLNDAALNAGRPLDRRGRARRSWHESAVVRADAGYDTIAVRR